MNNKHFLIIYDDDCIMCNKFILYVVKNDNGLFKLTGRKSEYVKKNQFLNESHENTDSLFLMIDKVLYTKAEAIAKILRQTSFVGKVLSVLISCFPKFISNSIYNIIAKKRRSFFSSRKNWCKINYQISSRIIS